jgi:tetratricopeptide (TPR) repeat protein
LSSTLIRIGSRTKRIALVGLVGAVAAAIAALVAFAGRAPDEQASLEGAPPLALDAALGDVPDAAELAAAEVLYREGRADEALEAFERILASNPESVEAAVGSAIARWPAGTTARLRTLGLADEARAVVQFHLGVALFWEQREQAAVNAWQEAITAEPDSPSALRAENLLFPEMPRGRPLVVPSVELVSELRDRSLDEQLLALQRASEAEPTADSAIAYGVALQRAGRAVSAREQFELAAQREPDNPEARAAAAIGLFEKADPTPTFATLGALSAEFPDAAVVRYHLALALVWLGDVGEARVQLEKASEVGGDDYYGTQANRLLGELARAEREDDG